MMWYSSISSKEARSPFAYPANASATFDMAALFGAKIVMSLVSFRSFASAGTVPVVLEGS